MAVKRSAGLMRQKWGESIGAGFSIGLVGFIGSLAIAVAALLLGMIHPTLGVAVGLAKSPLKSGFNRILWAKLVELIHRRF